MYYLSITEYTIIYLCLFMLKKIKKESINTIYIYIMNLFDRVKGIMNTPIHARLCVVDIYTVLCTFATTTNFGPFKSSFNCSLLPFLFDGH